MSNSKISALTGATTPLAGTEVLPIVQSSTTKQVSVANLTAGRTQTSNGIVQGTAATGYNFTANTPASGMTSQLLNWYEEGTWTPNQGSGLTIVGTFSSSGKYTRIGRTVILNGILNASTSIAVAAIGIMSTNPPFTPGATGLGEVINTTLTSSSVGVINIDSNIYSVNSISVSTTVAFQMIYTI